MAPPTLLATPRDPILAWVLAAAAGHVGVGAVFMLASMWAPPPPEPLLKPEENVIEVALMPMAKAALPQEAVRQAVPKAAEVAPEPPPPPPPEAPPPPPKVSEMVIHDTPEPVQPKETPKATPPPKATPAPAKPQEAAKPDSPRKTDPNAKMASLLDELGGAREGAKDQDAASPEGKNSPKPSRTFRSGAGNPEASAYINSLIPLFLAEFRPLHTLKGQGLLTEVLVTVDDTGAVKSAKVEKKSGNPSYDRAAVAAAQAVRKVPKPPPSLRDGTPDSYIIRFND